MNGYGYINHELLSSFMERWHTETSIFHLLIYEMTIILDDVSCLLHILNPRKLLNYSITSRFEALDMMVTYLGDDTGKAQ